MRSLSCVCSLQIVEFFYFFLNIQLDSFFPLGKNYTLMAVTFHKNTGCFENVGCFVFLKGRKMVRNILRNFLGNPKIIDFSKCKNYQKFVEEIFLNVAIPRDVDFFTRYSGKSCPGPRNPNWIIWSNGKFLRMFIMPRLQDNEIIAFLNGVQTH